jgi:hypothetical protein
MLGLLVVANLFRNEMAMKVRSFQLAGWIDLDKYGVEVTCKHVVDASPANRLREYPL